MNITLEVLITIFICIATAAIVWQSIILFSMAKVVKRVAGRAEGVISEAEKRLPGLLDEAQILMTESRVRLDVVTSNLADISTIVRNQAERVDALVTDVTDRARLQVVRFDEAIGNVFARIAGTRETVQRGVLRPIRDVNAVLHGVRTGLEFFLNRRTAQARTFSGSPEEEMFI